VIWSHDKAATEVDHGISRGIEKVGAVERPTQLSLSYLVFVSYIGIKGSSNQNPKEGTDGSNQGCVVL
jgi:hypothetical protein